MCKRKKENDDSHRLTTNIFFLKIRNRKNKNKAFILTSGIPSVTIIRLRYVYTTILNGRGNILINVHRRVVDNKYLFQIGLSALCKHYFFSHAQSTDDCQLSGDVKNKKINKTVSVFIDAKITSIT